MEKARFDELMKKFPNWVNANNVHEVFTFFDGHFTHKGGVGTPDEDDYYNLEQDEDENFIKIEFQNTGNRYIINEDRGQDLPVLQLVPIDSNEHQGFSLVPKV